MSLTSETLIDLANLNLSSEQMSGVLRILAKSVAEEEQRKAKQAERKRQSRDSHGTVTGQERDKAPPLIPPSDGFLEPSFTPPLISPPKLSSSQVRKEVVLPDWLPRQDWEDYAKWRKSQKGGFTPRMQELILQDLAKLWQAGEDPGKILQQSLKNGWKSVHEIKDKGQNYGSIGKINGQNSGQHQSNSRRDTPHEVFGRAWAGAAGITTES